MNLLLNKYLFKGSVIIILIIIGGITVAQEPTSTTTTQSGDSNQTSPELEVLKLEQQKAEAEKAIAEAEKATTEANMANLKAKWSISETKGKAGTITLNDSAGYYAEILAYLAMEDAAKEIAVKTREKLESGELIILGEVDLKTEKSLWNLLNLKLDLAIGKIKEAIVEYPRRVEADVKETFGIAEGLIATRAILGAVSDIAAFFKSNYTIYGKKITLNEKALIASVANEISTLNTTLKILLPDYNLTSSVSLYTKIDELNELVEELVTEREKIVDQLDKKIAKDTAKLAAQKKLRDDTKKELENANLNADEKERLNTKLEKIERDIHNLNRYERTKEKFLPLIDKDIQSAQTLISTLTAKTDSTSSLLENISSIDFIHQHSKAKILYVTITSQGGEVETSEASMSQGRISYLGGVAVTYFLTNAEGLYHQSGNVYKTKTKSFKRKEGPGALNIH